MEQMRKTDSSKLPGPPGNLNYPWLCGSFHQELLENGRSESKWENKNQKKSPRSQGKYRSVSITRILENYKEL